MKVYSRVHIGALLYTIILKDEDAEELEGNEGVCSPQQCAIYIRNDLPRSRFQEVLTHEIVHALFEASGVTHYLGQVITKGLDAVETEEIMVRMLAPMLLTMRPAKL